MIYFSQYFIQEILFLKENILSLRQIKCVTFRKLYKYFFTWKCGIMKYYATNCPIINFTVKIYYYLFVLENVVTYKFCIKIS